MESRVSNRKSANSISMRLIHQALRSHDILEQAATSLGVTTASLTTLLKRRGIVPSQLREVKIQDADAALGPNYDLPATKESARKLAEAGLITIEKKRRVFFNPILSELHNHILNSTTIMETATKLHTKKNTLLSLLTRTETSWSELRAISREVMKSVLKDEYEQPISLESIQLLHEHLSKKTNKRKLAPKSKKPKKKKRKTRNKVELGGFSFQQIHAAILKTNSTKEAAAELKVDPRVLSRYLIRLKINYTELRNLSAEEAQDILKEKYHEKITPKLVKYLKKHIKLKNLNQPKSDHCFPAQMSFARIHSAIYTSETIEKASESITLNPGALIKFLSRRKINFTILKKISPEFAQSVLNDDYHKPMTIHSVQRLLDAFHQRAQDVAKAEEQSELPLSEANPTDQHPPCMPEPQINIDDFDYIEHPVKMPDLPLSSTFSNVDESFFETSPPSSPWSIDEEWEKAEEYQDSDANTKNNFSTQSSPSISVTTFKGLSKFGLYAQPFSISHTSPMSSELPPRINFGNNKKGNGEL